jgi:hypothetical protein
MHSSPTRRFRCHVLSTGRYRTVGGEEHGGESGPNNISTAWRQRDHDNDRLQRAPRQGLEGVHGARTHHHRSDSLSHR